MRSCYRRVILSVIQSTILLLISSSFSGQNFSSTLSGIVVDAESRAPLSGALIKSASNTKGDKTTITDSLGMFRLNLPPGRHSISIEFMRYDSKTINDILIGTGSEVSVMIMLTERARQIGEAYIGADSRMTHNSMASVSAKRLKSQDAARFAAGYFDPLRMVTSVPGVSAGNDDDNNQIIIRGNSPKGMLWRIEGIEVPNPNHLSAGEGGSGGAYSVITTNSLSGFDFYTSAFPAEYGNATSGVMDLNLKTGSGSKHSYAVGLSVVGAEVSAEGPFAKGRSDSWFVNFRYANFDILKRYGIINSDEIGIIPSSYDWAAKASVVSKRAGTFEFFSAGGASQVGDLASDNKDSLLAGADNDEFLDQHLFAVVGVKHILSLPNEKTYIKTTAGITLQRLITQENSTDTLLNKTETSSGKFLYPALRVSVMLNHKFNSSNSLRIGTNINITSGDMFARKRVSNGNYDTLVNSFESGWYNSYYTQWKYKPASNIEINTGLHLFHSGITSQLIPEPRLGAVIYLSGDRKISFGAGLHSRLEPLSIYNYRVRTSGNERIIANKNLKATQALHFVLGLGKKLTSDLNLSFEAYYQYLFNVPSAKDKKSQYSLLNASYGLPDILLDNNGKGYNYGGEFMIEKDFTKNWYTLMSASLFDSKYSSADGKRYNTYYNGGYIFNFTAGKEFVIGKKGVNFLGFNVKALIRGGFRFTPVDYLLSKSRKRVVYDTGQTYGRNMPEYRRVDVGMSYKLNTSSSSLTILLEIQNITNRHNIVRKRFSYSKGSVIERESYSVGIVPVASLRFEF